MWYKKLAPYFLLQYYIIKSFPSSNILNILIEAIKTLRQIQIECKLIMEACNVSIKLNDTNSTIYNKFNDFQSVKVQTLLDDIKCITDLKAGLWN